MVWRRDFVSHNKVIGQALGWLIAFSSDDLVTYRFAPTCCLLFPQMMSQSSWSSLFSSQDLSPSDWLFCSGIWKS